MKSVGSGVAFIFSKDLVKVLFNTIKKEWSKGSDKTYKLLHLNYGDSNSVEEFLKLVDEYNITGFDLFNTSKADYGYEVLDYADDDAIIYKIENGELSESEYLEEDFYFFLIKPNSFNIFKPLFKNMNEIEEIIRHNLPWLPKDYVVSKDIRWIDFCQDFG